jgi:hypothetical protein
MCVCVMVCSLYYANLVLHNMACLKCRKNASSFFPLWKSCVSGLNNVEGHLRALHAQATAPTRVACIPTKTFKVYVHCVRSASMTIGTNQPGACVDCPWLGCLRCSSRRSASSQLNVRACCECVCARACVRVCLLGCDVLCRVVLCVCVCVCV